MVIKRVVYPERKGVKVMRVFDIAVGDILAAPTGCTIIKEVEWEDAVKASGKSEDEYLSSSIKATVEYLCDKIPEKIVVEDKSAL